MKTKITILMLLLVSWGLNAQISVDRTDLEFPAGGDVMKVNVTSIDGGWTIVENEPPCDWLSVGKSGDEALLITAQPNDSEYARETVAIEIKSLAGASAYINVMQLGADIEEEKEFFELSLIEGEASINDAGFFFDDKAQTIMIAVETNVMEWFISSNTCEWINVTSDEGSLTLVVEENTTGGIRICNLQFLSRETPTFIKAFMIEQTAKELAFNQFTVEGIVYMIHDNPGAVSVTTYEEGLSSSITISATVEYGGLTYPVSDIAENAFDGCHDLKKVTIEDGIGSIGDGAFSNTGIVEIIIPASVNYINSAYDNCNSLLSIIYLGEAMPYLESGEEIKYGNNTAPGRLLYAPNAADGVLDKDVWGVDLIIYGNTPLVASRGETTAVVTCALVDGAASYTVNVYSDDSKINLLFTLKFDADGKPTLRNTSDRINLDINNLSENQSYYIDIIATDVDENVLATQSSTIPTLGDFTASRGDVSKSSVAIYATGGYIVVKNLPADDTCSVYTITGNVLYRNVSSPLGTIELPAPAGIYIVRTTNSAAKVIMK